MIENIVFSESSRVFTKLREFTTTYSCCANQLPTQVVDSFSSGVERVQFVWESSTVKAIVSFFAVDVSTLPLHEQVHQEQFFAEELVESVEMSLRI